MKKASYMLSGILAVLGLIYFAALLLLAYDETGAYELLGVVWVFLFGMYASLIPSISIIGGWISFSKGTGLRSKWLSFLPFIINLFFVFIILFYGLTLYNSIMMDQFNVNYPIYNQMVNKIQSGQVKPETEDSFYIKPPKDFPAHAIGLHKEDDGSLRIYFMISGSLPMTKGGFLYLSDDHPEKVRNMTRKIKPCWYRYKS